MLGSLFGFVTIKNTAYPPKFFKKSNAPFDAKAFAEQLTQNTQINKQEGWVSGINQNIIQTTLENDQIQMADYIQQTNPEATVGEVIGTRMIIPSNCPKLAASLPYRVIAKHKIKELLESFRLQFSSYHKFPRQFAEFCKRITFSFKSNV